MNYTVRLKVTQRGHLFYNGEMLEPGGRVLALDLGRRRVGLAISDPLGLTAQGLPTLERRNRRADMAALREIIEQQNVIRVVIGNPRHLSGREGRQSESAAAFAEQLRREAGCVVVLWDERLTTAEAQRVLRESGVSLQKRVAAIDRMAAVILLQSYLDFQEMQDSGNSPRTDTDEHR